MGKLDKMRWFSHLYAHLWPKLQGAKVVITVLGGKLYTKRLIDELRRDGFEVLTPLAGMSIGKQQHWLKTEVEKR